MEYLLEEYFFSEEDLRLNADTLLWPINIGPIFDTNDEVSFINKVDSQNIHEKVSLFFHHWNK